MNIKKLFLTLGLMAVMLAVTFASVGALTPVHVSYFKAYHVARQMKVIVGAADSLNRPLTGAAVQVSFEKDGAPTILLNARTNIHGLAGFSHAVSSGIWVVCVEEINKAGFDYNPATNLCSTVYVP